MAIMAGSMAKGRQAWRWGQAKSSHLICKLEAEKRECAWHGVLKPQIPPLVTHFPWQATSLNPSQNSPPTMDQAFKNMSLGAILTKTTTPSNVLYQLVPPLGALCSSWL